MSMQMFQPQYSFIQMYCLTSFLAFLRRLGLLCKAGVQPGGGLAVVAEVQRTGRALGAGKTM